MSPSLQSAPRRLPAIQLVAAALIGFIILAQGISAPFQKDAEPQSAEWIVSVARDGNWLVPRDYYGFIDRKPPLYYWLSAVIAKVNGGVVDEAGARIVPVLSATLIAIEVLVWTVAEVGIAEGWLAFLFLLGIYGFSSRATLALTDMLMTAILMSAYLFLYPMLSGEVSRPRVIAVGILLGLGIATKGPIVLILVALAALIFVWLDRGSPMAILRSAWLWQIAAISIVIGASWYASWLISGGSRETAIFFQENFGHFMPAAMGGTGEASRPFWYIIARLIGGANPLILLMPATLAGFATGEVSGTRRRPLIFQASMVAAIVIFFSIASAKRDDYILPALPGVAILCAGAFGMGAPTRGYAGGAKIRDGVSALIAFAAILAVVLGLATARTNPDMTLQSSDAVLMMLLERGIGTHSAPFVALLIISALAAVSTLILLLRHATFLAGAMIGIISLTGVILIDSVVRPELAWARSYKSFIGQIRSQIDDYPLFVVREADFELAFYYGKGVPPLVGKRAIVPPANSPAYLIARDGELSILPREYRDRIQPVLKSNLLGKEGPPTLYVIDTSQGGLNSRGGIGR